VLLLQQSYDHGHGSWLSPAPHNKQYPRFQLCFSFRHLSSDQDYPSHQTPQSGLLQVCNPGCSCFSIKLRLPQHSQGRIWTSNAKPTPTSSTRTSDWMELPDRECQLYTYLRLLKMTFTSFSNQKWAAIFHVNTEVLSKCK